MIMMVVSTSGRTTECWEQNGSRGSLNKIAIKFTTSCVIFMLIQIFIVQSHISYLSIIIPEEPIVREEFFCKIRKLFSSKRSGLSSKRKKYSKKWKKINYTRTFCLYESEKLAEMVVEKIQRFREASKFWLRR